MARRPPRPHAGEWIRRPSIADPPTTVLMPAYNSQSTVRQTVESVLVQTAGDLELLVVDDAGATPVAGPLSSIDDPRLGIFRHARNHNTSGARNTAVAFARAPLVSQLDADDLWEPDYLETVLPLFGDPRIGLAYTNAHMLGHPDGIDDFIDSRTRPRAHPIDRFPEIAEQNRIATPTPTMRTEAVRSVGGYSEHLWGHSDWDMYVRLAFAGWRFAYVDRQLACYRWPTPQSKASDLGAMERSRLRMWVGFALRHPRLPGPRYQARMAVNARLRGVARRRRPLRA